MLRCITLHRLYLHRPHVTRYMQDRYLHLSSHSFLWCSKWRSQGSVGTA